MRNNIRKLLKENDIKTFRNLSNQQLIQIINLTKK